MDIHDIRMRKSVAVAEYLRLGTGNFVGVGIGGRFARNKVRRGENCLRFYVSNKIEDPRMLGRSAVSDFYDGAPTDVVEIGRFVPLSHLYAGRGQGQEQKVHAQAGPGSSIGPESARHDALARGGTFGAVVQDESGVYVLSCNHVLAANGLARPVVVQPSRMTSAMGTPIATLARWEPLESGIDCAIAKLDQPDSIPRGRVKLMVAASDGMKVTRDAEGAAAGIVIDIDASVRVHYPQLGTFEFDDQIVISDIDPADPFSAPGDSGSLVLDQEERAVGLLFAGSESHVEINGQRVRVAVATPIKTVLDRLGVDFATGGNPAAQVSSSY